MSFAALKKQSKTQFDKISNKIEAEKTGGYQRDERFWKLDVDKTGNGYAVIRFLSAPDGEEFPYVKRYEYMTKIGQRYYAENCRSTLGLPDPMNEYFFEVRGDGSDKAKNTAARQFSRSTNYIANIYVVEDKKHPENEGKVFLFKFGARIFQKLEGAISPEFEDESPFNPFDMWAGANFKLKARELDGQRSYDKSGFDVVGPLLDDDEALESVWRAQFSLQAEIAPEKFKSYEVLLKKRDELLAAANKAPATRRDEDDGDDRPTPRKASTAPAASRRSAAPPAEPVEFDDVPDLEASKPAKPAKPKAEPKDDAPAEGGDDDGLAAYRDFLNA